MNLSPTDKDLMTQKVYILFSHETNNRSYKFRKRFICGKKEHPSTLSRVEGCLCYSRLYSIVVTTRTRLMNGVLASRSSMENCPW